MISTDNDQMEAVAGTFDYILNTVPVEHDIVCDIEMLDIRNINNALERMQTSDVRYRFVIDMETLRG